MSSRRHKTPGWAAFDPKNQPKQFMDIETHNNDPYPPISTKISALQNHQNPSTNGNLTGKSFFSVLTHSSSVQNTIASGDAHNPLMENSQSEKLTSKYVENVTRVNEKLKIDHPWANENLIEDIMAAVDNDIGKASALLNEMAPHGGLQEKKITELDNIEEVGLPPTNDERLDEHNNTRSVLLGGNVPLGFMMDISMIPVEPEWEDDDMYLMHRKEAIRAMRLASRHSKAASEAYLRKDHAAAQEYSLKAQDEWNKAEKLHAKAAKEILTIRNCENDDWKLDLHGLHATEAVQVLQEHLLKIESQLSTKPDKTNVNVGLETEKSERQQLYKPRLLEVITGKGSHSRGEAALPVAIKSFLSEKGYYNYEARTGVITVQPKFRKIKSVVASN